MHSKKYTYLFSFLALLSISPAFGQLKDILNEEYELVEVENNSRIPQAYRLITTTLPINVFPLLPTSYKWVKEGDEYIVMKHRNAPLHVEA